MHSLRKYLRRFPFLIRLFNWEYWPFDLLQVPVAFYYCWLAAKARTFFFFSAANPSIETGGMFGESKWKIFELLPKHLYPETIFISENSSSPQIQKLLLHHGIGYPLIAKPDRGERGWLVSKIENETGLRDYAARVKVDFLIQKYIDQPVELSVFYYRYPGASRGVISSVVEKQMLSVTGDGKSSLRKLIEEYPRALLQLPALELKFGDRLKSIPALCEKVELVPIGNHSKGAMFLDACNIVDEQMTQAFDSISKQIDGFFYGRYDLRCASIEALKRGEIQILELNGAGAEPAHIYHPGASIIKAYAVLFNHFRVLYEISTLNHKKGIPYMTLKEFMQQRRRQKLYKQKANGK